MSSLKEKDLTLEKNHHEQSLEINRLKIKLAGFMQQTTDNNNIIKDKEALIDVTNTTLVRTPLFLQKYR